jgi:enoyl-CoA hydratase/carnithine racemase
MNYTVIRYEKDAADKFATITIARPEKMNAINKDVIHQIDSALAEAVADPDVNALILTGEGDRAFSSGYDLQAADYDVDIETWQADMTENSEAILNIWRAPIPIIAAVNGYALAGALELMMACDLAIASETARFGEPEVRHNSGPPTLMMPWLMATRDVRWLMYTGDLVDAQEALRMHLVNKVVPAAELRECAVKLARKLARMPVPAIKFAKMTLNQQQMIAGLQASFDYNVNAIAALHVSKAGREWMGKLGKVSLKEYLATRDRPFDGLDF